MRQGEGFSGLRLPFFTELEEARTVLVAGAGGGFDVFCGLPLYFALEDAGKEVYLGNLSFSALDAARGGRPIGPACLEVTADTVTFSDYFPEIHLSRWFRQQGRQVPVYCFDRTGYGPVLESYQALVAERGIDTVVLVDGGTDSLMRGDEAGLGTPEEDMTSVAVVADLQVTRKVLVCVGFGVDNFHGVCHAHNLEAVAELTRLGAFLGAFSLVREMPEVQRYGDAVRAVFEAMPDHPSIVSASILSALEGHYGDFHLTERTRGSELWINPLMALYWCFRLEPVALRIRYLDEIRTTRTYWDVMEAIDRFRRSSTVRPRTPIPEVSLARRTAR